MTIEDEILFQKYGITGYRNPDAGVCDDTASASREQHPGPDDCEGLGGDSSGHRDT